MNLSILVLRWIYRSTMCGHVLVSQTRHQNGDTHFLTLEEILDETKLLDISMKQKQWLMTEVCTHNIIQSIVVHHLSLLSSASKKYKLMLFSPRCRLWSVIQKLMCGMARMASSPSTTWRTKKLYWGCWTNMTSWAWEECCWTKWRRGSPTRRRPSR